MIIPELVEWKKNCDKKAPDWIISIKTPEDWWSVCEANWEKILELMPQFLRAPYTRDKAKQAKEKKDYRYLEHCFNDIWFNLPDVIEIHAIPGFHALCDLCSEVWVFNSDVELETE